MPRFVVDNSPIEFEEGQTVLEAMLRAGRRPTGGGCLCAAGDCPHCLATVDGVAYVRTCQTPARAGMVVASEHADGAPPPLPLGEPASEPDPGGVPVRYVHCDVVVVGQGESGRAAAAEVDAEPGDKTLLAFDARRGEEVIGIYPGPLVVVRTPGGMVHVHPADPATRMEIVVATGAAEIQPVAPGNELNGIVTARAAERLAAAGVDLGRIVAIGTPPSGVGATAVTGELVRFEGNGGNGNSRVDAVVVASSNGVERRVECDTVSVGLGLYPRDALARMANGIGGLEVRVVGDAALPAYVPPCPREGVVCPCSAITVEHLDQVWSRGFREMELLKRATLAGTGTCQGSVCIPYLRSFLADRGEELQPPFTARPLTKQRTIGEIAAGAYHHATPRTALDGEHRRLGAQMERAGGWYRPWSYGSFDEEYQAVRQAVSIGDVSTLGKMLVSGPDALEFLERLYPTKVATLKPGRSRYALLLDERGYVFDDGLVCRDECAQGELRFRLTFTSAGATMAELWMRYWADLWELDVRLMNQTMSLGAINVTGPRAAELLERARATTLPAFGAHERVSVAGVDCRVYRLSFTGELSYELHHAAADSVRLWRALLELGRDLGCKPHGLDALFRLRLEKGHIIVGQDTDYDSTARRLHHDWAVKLDKDDFVGKLSVQRTNRFELDRQLVGLEMESPAPIEGAVIYGGTGYVGNVTSSTYSLVLGKAVMLGWVNTLDEDGTLPKEVTIGGRPARLATLPFYDPEGMRARTDVPPIRRSPSSTERSGAAEGDGITESVPPHAPTTPTSIGQRTFESVVFTRVVATETAIDQALAALDPEILSLRTAPDEALVAAELPPGQLADRHAIVEPETSFAAAWFPADEAAAILEATCEWLRPTQRPAFAQGAVAGLPVRLWLEADRVLFVVPTAYVRDLEQRIGLLPATGSRPPATRSTPGEAGATS